MHESDGWQRRRARAEARRTRALVCGDGGTRRGTIGDVAGFAGALPGGDRDEPMPMPKIVQTKPERPSGLGTNAAAGRMSPR